MIRAWVPGCATGEDAYALALLLIERAEAAGATADIRVFATETDAAALALGREGLYPANIASRLSPERLRRFFVREARGVRVGHDLRRRLFFAAHDVVHDPPYPELGLIYYSGLLAGFDVESLPAVDRSFRRGLRAGGFLVEGRPRSAPTLGAWFEIVSGAWGVHRRTTWPHIRAPGSGFAAVFLSRQLRVRGITPVMMGLFDLSSADLGRSVEDLASTLDDPDLSGDARAALECREPISRQVRGPRGRWFIRRVQPCRPAGNAPATWSPPSSM